MAVVTPMRPGGGAYAQSVVVDEASVVAVPDNLSLAQASRLPMNGLTAWLALDTLDLDIGDRLLVTGGAGLLASYVIGLAKQDAIRVYADAAPDDRELVEGFGADIVPAVKNGGAIAAVRRFEGESGRDVEVHRVRVFDVLDRTDQLQRLANLAGGPPATTGRGDHAGVARERGARALRAGRRPRPARTGVLMARDWHASHEPAAPGWLACTAHRPAGAGT